MRSLLAGASLEMAAAGPDKKLCEAPTPKGKYPTCRRTAGAGTGDKGFGSCLRHGGSTVTHEKAGQLEQAKATAGLLSIPVSTNPFDSLRQLEAEAAGYVEYFRRQVQELDPDMIYVRPASILRRPLDEGKEGENPSVMVEELSFAPVDLNIAIKAHRQAMEDLRRISKTVIDTNLGERIVQLQEKDSRVFATAVSAIVVALGHKLSDVRVQGIIRAQLEAIEGTATEVG